MSLSLRPMTDDEFVAFRAYAVDHYGVDVARSKGLSAEDGRADAERQTAALLPDGNATAGQLLFVAVDGAGGGDGAAVGTLWLSTTTPDGLDAGWIYDVEIDASHRGKGYGRELMRLAEHKCRELGLTSLGLNVFGPNVVARQLYESLGYEITAQSMAKPLD
ncbi:MAG TPA: GNAT family N-acetyltransferase [Jatrophihabitantaceae bacterium]|jgi:ribosomal protein S18 acetylase RimI-like enzyme